MTVEGSSGAVVRRSALESAHEALGARWVSLDIRWPIDYGTTHHDAGSADVGAAEIGPLEECLIRGPGALQATAGLAAAGSLPVVGRTSLVGVGGDGAVAWVLGPDEVLLVAPLSSAMAALVAKVASDDVSVIDMTGARTSIRLAGLSAPALLAELCPDDTRPDAMAEGDLIQAPLAGVRAFIARQDAPTGPGYTIMIARDEALYVWEAVIRLGVTYGLRPVGPATIAPVGA